MDGKPILYILCGRPFAGKSTLARAMASARGVTVVETDAINTERGLGLNGAAITPEQWDATFAEAYRRVGALLDAGRDAAFDSTAYTREQRDLLRGLARAHGARAVVLFVDVPAETSWRRWHENRHTGARNDVRDEDFLNVVEHFEPPEDDERPLRYDGTEPVEEWVRRELLIGNY
jgi:predicted kinase